MITNVEPLQHVKLLQVNLIKVFFFMRVKEARHKIPHCASCTSRIITFGIKHNLQNQDGVPSCWLACLA